MADQLAHYELLSPLGAGGMGEVFRARDTHLDREVAIKILPEAFAGDAERLARFEREGRALAAINHPGIVTVHSVEDADGVRFLTMELVTGESLERQVVPGGLPVDRVLELGIALSDALAAAVARASVVLPTSDDLTSRSLRRAQFQHQAQIGTREKRLRRVEFLAQLLDHPIGGGIGGMMQSHR